MFTIDLLNGDGIPIKSRPEGMAIGGLTVIVPLTIATIMFSSYVHDRIVISVHKRTVTSYKTRTDELSDAVKLHKSFEKEKDLYSRCLYELESCIGGRTQWSPILTTVVRNIPDQVVLTKLDVKRRFIRKKVPQKGDPKKKVDISVPASTLTMNIAAVPQSNSDDVVRGFREYLLRSDSLRPKLEGINVSQESGKLGGQEVVSYQIDCLFKPAL